MNILIGSISFICGYVLCEIVKKVLKVLDTKRQIWYNNNVGKGSWYYGIRV